VPYSIRGLSVIVLSVNSVTLTDRTMTDKPRIE